MEDEFRDLAPLRPSLDAERWERLVGAVEAAAEPELARRAALADGSVLLLLARWRRPALGAAALAAILSGVVILSSPSSGSVDAASIAEALGYPASVNEWVEGGAPPSVEELLVAMEATDDPR